MTKIDKLDALEDAITTILTTNRYNNIDNNLDKVNRCLARYSLRATATNQPINRAPNELARPIFWAKFGLFWAKNSFFLLEKSKVCYPHNGKPT